MRHETPPSQDEDQVRGPDQGVDLWRILLAPSVWGAHFLAVYILAAIHCEKAGRGAELAPLWAWIGGLTLVALAAILWVAWTTWAVHARSQTEGDFDYEHDTAEERHRFLSHVALMLAVLSAAAVCFTAWPVMSMEVCR